MPKTNRLRGFGVVEVLIASAIISTTIFSLYYIFALAQGLNSEAGEKIKANFLAEEGLEAVRFLRDSGWSTNLSVLSSGTTYYLSFNKGSFKWSIGTGGLSPIDSIFYRKITVENVSRDSNDDIVSSGGTNDPDSKKINVEVSWRGRRATTTVTISTYLSDIFNN